LIDFQFSVLGECILTFGFNFGLNHGPNSVEAVNVPIKDRIDYGMKHFSCVDSCPNGRFGLDIGPIVKKYKSPKVYVDWLKRKKFNKYF